MVNKLLLRPYFGGRWGEQLESRIQFPVEKKTRLYTCEYNQQKHSTKAKEQTPYIYMGVSNIGVPPNHPF